MIFIGLLNSVKQYFANKHAEQSLRSLDSHSLRDIGFYQDNGRIRPLSGTNPDQLKAEVMPQKPNEQPQDG